MEIPFDKGDPTLEQVADALLRVGHSSGRHYEPVFESREVDEAELLRSYVRVNCGESFRTWASKLGLPSNTLVMDKREMEKHDIAITFDFEVVVSSKFREVLVEEALTGWEAHLVQHIDSGEDRFPHLFHLSSTNRLPALAPETDLHFERHTKPLLGTLDLPVAADPLAGTVGVYQRGPMRYRRSDLRKVEDFNYTREEFGEEVQKHPLFILSQRAWRVFRKHNVRNVDVEPVIID